nr:unnamed protein product [Callosobruchus analis]
MNNYQAAAAAAAQGFGPPPASPHAPLQLQLLQRAAGPRQVRRAAASRQPILPAPPKPASKCTMGPPLRRQRPQRQLLPPTVASGYVQATSPQPNTFPAIAVSRAPLNYSPVSSFV